MKIVFIEYSIAQKSIDIFLSGCLPPFCDGCCNPELQSFEVGEEYSEQTINNIKKYIQDYDNLIDNIFIVGGEPLHQDIYALRHLLRESSLLNKKIWLFTRLNLEDVPNNIKCYCDYIKIGKYDKELLTDDNIQFNIKLATSNQIIYKKGIDY